jgi:putative ATPase
MARRPPPRSSEPTLLEAAAARGAVPGGSPPLADRMRPQTLGEIAGQRHLLGPERLLAHAIATDRVPSMILWGPPGSGKTTLARVVSRTTRSVFVPFSAVLGGVPELREILTEAKDRRAYEGRATLLFVDEIHRFNKAQQDAFLPHVEDGTITLIGATTENPSFSVNAAILSRCKVFHLDPLTDEDVALLLRRALTDPVRGLGARRLEAEDAVLAAIARAASGDARRALGLLETAAALLPAGATRLDLDTATRAGEDRTLLYDKSGEEHHNVTSALIKSLRGSDPDAAIYWLMRMLDAGDAPAFVLRRLVIFASEDVGNADPRALTVAVAADAAFHRLGMPEGLYPIAQACLYLATAPKSNSVGRAFSAARASIQDRGALAVPMKLRNAPTALMKAEGYGEGYQYAHDHGGFVPGETYLPDEIVGETFYAPSREGYELTIGERLARWRRRGDEN